MSLNKRQILDQLHHGLYQKKPLLELRAHLVAFRDQGGDWAEALHFCENLRANTLEDELEVRIMEVMDFIVGWCAKDMTIWDMSSKHPTITHLLTTLAAMLDFTHLQIVDHWDGDLCAVGIQMGGKLVYISTCTYLDHPTPHCDFDFELLDPAKLDAYNVVQRGRGVSTNALVNEMKAFFEI